MRAATFAIVSLSLACATTARPDETWADVLPQRWGGLEVLGTDDCVVVVTNYDQNGGRIIDRATGAIRFTLADVPVDATFEQYVAGDRSYGAPGKRGVLAEGDLLVVRRSGKQKVWQLSTGAELPVAAFLSFARCRGGVVVLAGEGSGRVERLVAPGATGGWTKEVAGIQANTVLASEAGVVVAGPGGWTELDAAGKELRSWRLPEGELPTTENDLAATRTHVVGATVLTFHPAREGGVKLRIFTGKRPKEVNVGELAEPGLKVYAWTDEEVLARRGKKTYGVLARTPLIDGAKKPPAGEQTVVSVDLVTGALGPEVVKSAPEFLGGNGHAWAHNPAGRGAAAIVDVVTGTFYPSDDYATSLHSSFRIAQRSGTLTCYPLAGGPPLTWKLPDPKDSTLGASARGCPCQDWLGVTNRTAGRTSTPIGVLDLRNGKLLPLGTLPGEVEACVEWIDSRPKGTLYFVRTTEARKDTLKLLRRDAPYRR